MSCLAVKKENQIILSGKQLGQLKKESGYFKRKAAWAVKKESGYFKRKAAWAVKKKNQVFLSEKQLGR